MSDAKSGKPFEMPYVEIGDTVYHYGGVAPSGDPVAAIVTQVGDRAVNLSVIAPGHHDLPIKSGVRHADDPDLRSKRNEGGCWVHTPRNIAINALLAFMDQEKVNVPLPPKRK